MGVLVAWGCGSSVDCYFVVLCFIFSLSLIKPFALHSDGIRGYFSRFGEVVDAVVKTDSNTGRPRYESGRVVVRDGLTFFFFLTLSLSLLVALGLFSSVTVPL